LREGKGVPVSFKVGAEEGATESIGIGSVKVATD